MSLQDLVIAGPQGLYCPAGDFYIAPRLLMAYSLGKAQCLLAGVDAQIGPIVVPGAVAPLNKPLHEADPLDTLAGLLNWPGAASG